MQTNYNEVAVLQQGAGKVTGARKLVKKVNIHMRDIEMSGKMKRLKRKMEVQKITFNYFAWPQPRNWNFLCNDDDGHTKNNCCPVSKFVVVVWDGLDESDISRPEILFQSTPDCAVTPFRIRIRIRIRFISSRISQNWSAPDSIRCFINGE